MGIDYKADLRVATPAVALETAFLTSGLPGDRRREAARRMAAAVRAQTAHPAFIGVLSGRAIIGLKAEELERLASAQDKLSTRDLAPARVRGGDGGCTVAATTFLAHRAGLAVVATGGIGGVHPSPALIDVSADLTELARTPIILVCSGPKAITDIHATWERLETLGVTVAGFQTEELPAFWSAESGVRSGLSLESAAEAVEVWRASRLLGTSGALLVCVPPPPAVALSREESERAVSQASTELRKAKLRGPGVTPFLLSRIAELTDGRSMTANLALLENNAAVAASIARAVNALSDP